MTNNRWSIHPPLNLCNRKNLKFVKIAWSLWMSHCSFCGCTLLCNDLYLDYKWATEQRIFLLEFNETSVHNRYCKNTESKILKCTLRILTQNYCEQANCSWWLFYESRKGNTTYLWIFICCCCCCCCCQVYNWNTSAWISQAVYMDMVIWQQLIGHIERTNAMNW